MRMLCKNKQKMHYALLLGEGPIYVLDDEGHKIVDYITEEGDVIYKETGSYELTYSQPVFFNANISMSGGEAQVQEYGIDTSGYDAVVIMEKGKAPITETSLIWFQSEVGYKDADKTIVDGFTADYRVAAVKPSLNHVKLLLSAVSK